jgi:hypothetical protein
VFVGEAPSEESGLATAPEAHSSTGMQSDCSPGKAGGIAECEPLKAALNGAADGPLGHLKVAVDQS